MVGRGRAAARHIVVGDVNRTYTATFVTVDTTAPTVTAIAPASGATNVLVGTTVRATFSEAMSASTITTSTVRLVEKATSRAVAATVVYDAASRTATLRPAAALKRNIVYMVMVMGGSPA